MKNSFYLFLMLSFFLFSCGGSTEQSTDNGNDAVKTEQTDEAEGEADLTIKDCDDFLDKYDEWSDDYLKVMKAWKEDPTDITLGEEFQKLSESMTTWYSEWTGYVQCAAQEKYQERFEEIGDKIDKGMEEMGLGN